MNEGKDDLKSRLETLLDRKKEKFVKIENIYYDDEKKTEIKFYHVANCRLEKNIYNDEKINRNRNYHVE